MGGSTPGTGDDVAEPRRLRQLRRLVTALTATLIVGVIAIVVLLVIRLWSLPGGFELPPQVAVPEGEDLRAVTLGTGWIAVVTVDGQGRERIRVIDSATGAERGMIAIAD